MEKTKSLEAPDRPRAAGRVKQFLDEVLFVVVAYKQSLICCRSWTSLEACLSREGLHAELYIYDNSPEPQAVQHSLHISSHYHHDATNPGVSAAFNAACRFATRREKKWILLLDQDTRLGGEAISHYAAAVDAHPSHPLFAPLVVDTIGIISPFRFRNGRGMRVSGMHSGFLPLKTFRAVNAGLLISCELFGRVGGYEQEIALDFSDIAFLEKVQPLCLSLCLVDTTLEQDFSGTSLDDLQATVERFRKYCEGAHTFANRFSRRGIRRTSFLRAVKLSLRWKELEFMRIHFKAWNG